MSESLVRSCTLMAAGGGVTASPGGFAEYPTIRGHWQLKAWIIRMDNPHGQIRGHLSPSVCQSSNALVLPLLAISADSRLGKTNALLIRLFFDMKMAGTNQNESPNDSWVVFGLRTSKQSLSQDGFQRNRTHVWSS
jgi:hypothetical protein